MKYGWIKLHRQLNKNPIWFEEPFTKGQAWVDLVMNANHIDGKFTVRGIEIPIKRGQIGWSEVTMAGRWQWSRMKVRRYLKRLESDTQVIQQKLFKITSIITIINYEKYQGDTSNDTTDDTTDDTQTRMIKKEKNKKSKISEPSSVEPLAKNKINKNKKMWNKTSDDFEGEFQIDPDHKPKGKKIKAKKVSDDVQEVFDLFNNPASALWRMREIERVAAQALFDTYGIEKLKVRVRRISEEKEKKDPYFPDINTPSELLDKMPKVERYLNI